MEEHGPPPEHSKPWDQRKDGAGEEGAGTHIPQLLRPLKLLDLPAAVTAMVASNGDIGGGSGNGSSNGENKSKLLLPPPSSSLWMPRLMYGTAWKGERTEDLVYEALRAGFRAIDTAAQPRFYDEAAVGRGIQRAMREGILKREDLFVRISWQFRGERALHIKFFFQSPSLLSSSCIYSLHSTIFHSHPPAYFRTYLFAEPLPLPYFHHQ